jgi:hypothetical protein
MQKHGKKHIPPNIKPICQRMPLPASILVYVEFERNEKSQRIVFSFHTEISLIHTETLYRLTAQHPCTRDPLSPEKTLPDFPSMNYFSAKKTAKKHFL